MSFLVETPDGILVRKERPEISTGDFLVVDGPGAFESTDILQQKLQEEILAAGGLQAWQRQQEPHLA